MVDKNKDIPVENFLEGKPQLDKINPVDFSTPEKDNLPPPEVTPSLPEKKIEQPITVPTEAEQPRETEKPLKKIESRGFLEEAIKGLTEKLHGSKRKPTQIPRVRDNLTVQIEKIMEDGLQDAFKELTPIQQQEFKIKGEETAFQIRALLKATHVKIKKIFRLILEWLKMLPGINRFFLEQEAKIKTDKILALKHFDRHR